MRVRAALVAVALLATVAACGGSAASPGQSASASQPAAASLAIPSAAAQPTAEASVAPIATPATGTTYTVKKGDTLWAIAQKYKTTIKAIQDANPTLKNPDVLKIGQKLVIPAP